MVQMSFMVIFIFYSGIHFAWWSVRDTAFAIVVAVIMRNFSVKSFWISVSVLGDAVKSSTLDKHRICVNTQLKSAKKSN